MMVLGTLMFPSRVELEIVIRLYYRQATYDRHCEMLLKFLSQEIESTRDTLV